jgi:5-(carboxyamino)imidazole ribonucleotide synthase
MEQLVSSDFKLGVVAGGQLGKMLTLAASNWDVKTFVMDSDPNCPSAHTSSELVIGDFRSFDDVLAFGRKVDLLTIEIEHVNVDALDQLLKEGVCISPHPEALRIIQDKGLQKQFYQENDLPSAAFRLFESADAIRAAYAEGSLELPFVQKSRTEGYDGRGVFVAKTQEDLDRLLPTASVVEAMVNLSKELAVVVCRNPSGETKCFPPVEMQFNPEANLVEFLMCPADVSEAIAKASESLAEKVAESMKVVGILAVEMFLDEEGTLLVNEVAPRPHNSGHHTIETLYTSQYEQHLRAIFGFPLGSTRIKVPSIMINILGEPGYAGPVKYQGLTECMAVEGVKFHIYGKKETRPFRKMGHATIMDPDIHRAVEKARYVQQTLKVIA